MNNLKIREIERQTKLKEKEQETKSKLEEKYFENYYSRIIENGPFSLQTQSHESKDRS